MAYVNGEWLARPERQERIKLVSERAKKLRALIESGRATTYHTEALRSDIAELKRLKRIDRAEDDMLYFSTNTSRRRGIRAIRTISCRRRM